MTGNNKSFTTLIISKNYNSNKLVYLADGNTKNLIHGEVIVKLYLVYT